MATFYVWRGIRLKPRIRFLKRVVLGGQKKKLAKEKGVNVGGKRPKESVHGQLHRI